MFLKLINKYVFWYKRLDFSYFLISVNMSRRELIEELYKPARRNFKRRKVVVKGINDLLQVDLCDFQKLAKYNKGFKYLLTAINCFTKRGYAIPIKSKKASEVANACAQILRHEKVKLMQADAGK